MDTGGTYTDAVIMDLESGELLEKAKSPTTHEDLRIGIRGALDLLDGDLLSKVGIVSLSTTLATNAVVEGKGARVALLCIGCLYNNSVSPDFQTTVKGGHNLHGTEVEPFDERSAQEFMEMVRGKVDAIAIVSYMAVRNPGHEKRARDLARDVLGIPVVCGHELSSSLGFSDRVTTCVMNAALLPVMAELIDSVRAMLDSHEVRAPLMMVRGDGTLMGEAIARERPVEATASGPAASIIGAMNLSGRKDGIVLDTGGTTTDIGLFRDGAPRLSPDGAVLGGKRTKVNAVQVTAVGLGGDTRFVLRRGTMLTLDTVRAIPLCVASERWHQVREELYRPLGERVGSRNTEFVVALGDPDDMGTYIECKLMELLKTPMHPNSACGRAGARPMELIQLINRGLVHWIGFTPTDMMHCTGEYVVADRGASMNAAESMAVRCGMSTEGFLEECRTHIRRRLCRSIMSELVHESRGSFELGPGGEDMVEHAMFAGSGYDCSLRLDMPIVGMGAPAKVFAGLVGEVFDVECIVSEHSDVGNAIGAVTSTAAETIDVLVKPVSARKQKGYEAFSRLGRFIYKTYEDAVDDSIEMATAFVRQMVARSGVDFPDVTVDCKDTDMIVDESGSPVTVQTRIRISAAGKPKAIDTI